MIQLPLDRPLSAQEANYRFSRMRIKSHFLYPVNLLAKPSLLFNLTLQSKHKLRLRFFLFILQQYTFKSPGQEKMHIKPLGSTLGLLALIAPINAVNTNFNATVRPSVSQHHEYVQVADIFSSLTISRAPHSPGVTRWASTRAFLIRTLASAPQAS